LALFSLTKKPWFCFLDEKSSFPPSRFLTHRLSALTDIAFFLRKTVVLYNDGYRDNIADRTPAEFAAGCSRGKDGNEGDLESAARFALFHRTATAGIMANRNSPSTRLLRHSLELHSPRICRSNPVQTEPRRPEFPANFGVVSRRR